MRIVAYRQAIVDGIKAKIPDIRDCRTHDGKFDLNEAKGISARAPAVFVAVLGTPGNVACNDGQRKVTLQMGAFIVARGDRHERSDVVALNLGEILLGWVPKQRFGEGQVGHAEQVNLSNLYSTALRKESIAMMAVTWRQALVIGEPDDQTEDPPVPGTVWLGEEPFTGLGNEEHYEELTDNA